MANQVLRFALDFANVESADNGDTTYFGGFYTIDGVEFQAKGNDRSDNYQDDVLDHIMAKCKEKWSDLVSDEDAMNQLMFELHEAIDLTAQDEAGTIVVTRATFNSIFEVTFE